MGELRDQQSGLAQGQTPGDGSGNGRENGINMTLHLSFYQFTSSVYVNM